MVIFSCFLSSCNSEALHDPTELAPSIEAETRGAPVQMYKDMLHFKDLNTFLKSLDAIDKSEANPKAVNKAYLDLNITKTEDTLVTSYPVNAVEESKFPTFRSKRSIEEKIILESLAKGEDVFSLIPYATLKTYLNEHNEVRVDELLIRTYANNFSIIMLASDYDNFVKMRSWPFEKVIATDNVQVVNDDIRTWKKKDIKLYSSSGRDGSEVLKKGQRSICEFANSHFTIIDNGAGNYIINFKSDFRISEYSWTFNNQTVPSTYTTESYPDGQIIYVSQISVFSALGSIGIVKLCATSQLYNQRCCNSLVITCPTGIRGFKSDSKKNDSGNRRLDGLLEVTASQVKLTAKGFKKRGFPFYNFTSMDANLTVGTNSVLLDKSRCIWFPLNGSQSSNGEVPTLISSLPSFSFPYPIDGQAGNVNGFFTLTKPSDNNLSIFLTITL